MIETHVNGVPCFKFPNLAEIPGIRHGVFTRKGGCSRGPFESLNVGLSVGDSAEAVHKNRSAILSTISGGELVFINQIHGSRVLVHSRADTGGNGPGLNKRREGDAIISDTPGINLGIQTADCQSILLYDPVRRAVGNIHSGWRGSIRNIIGHTVAKMTEAFGTRPVDLMAGIGPSLGPCCAEFVNYRREIPESFWPYKAGEHHFDFWALSTDQLATAGVPVENIAMSGLCTRCRTDLFFSYRGEKTTGRFAAVIGLA